MESMEEAFVYRAPLSKAPPRSRTIAAKLRTVTEELCPSLPQTLPLPKPGLVLRLQALLVPNSMQFPAAIGRLNAWELGNPSFSLCLPASFLIHAEVHILGYILSPRVVPQHFLQSPAPNGGTG